MFDFEGGGGTQGGLPISPILVFSLFRKSCEHEDRTKERFKSICLCFTPRETCFSKVVINKTPIGLPRNKKSIEYRNNEIH